MHAGHHEAGHADHFVHAHGHRAHARRNHGRQAAARALRRQARFDDRLLGEDRRDHAAARPCPAPCVVAPTGTRAGPVGQLDVFFFQDRADFEILGREHDLRRRRRGLGGLRPVDQHAVEQQAGARGHDKCEGQNANKSFIHLDPCSARLDPPAPAAGNYLSRSSLSGNSAATRLRVLADFFTRCGALPVKLQFPGHAGDDR